MMNYIEVDEIKKQEDIVNMLRSIPTYDEVVRFIENDDWSNINLSLFTLTHKHGIFEIYTREFVDNLAIFIERKFGKNIKIVEVCAGDGRLSKALIEKGFDIIAVDDRSRQSEEKQKRDIDYPDFVINISALDYIKNNKPDLIIVSWVEYGDNLDVKLVETGIPLIIIGEYEGGCTGSEKFWNRKDFVYEHLKEVSRYNISRTDSKFGIHHTSTHIVEVVK